MSYLDRVLADSTDRESWQIARGPRIGASDAAKFAKMQSVPTYVNNKLDPHEFRGNASTESGNRWEPMLLAWAGIPQNTRLFHHPSEDGFAATPDGINEISAGKLVLGEVKAKHNRIVLGPTPAELRQVAWQLFVFPEAIAVEWIWGELIEVRGQWELREDSPKSLTFARTDPKIISVQTALIPIATAVLAGMRESTQLKEAAGF